MEFNGGSLPEDELKDLLKEALKYKLNPNKGNKKINLDNALYSTLNEFLGSFILLGYDFEDTPKIVKSCETDLERDALRTLLMKYVAKIMYEETREDY